MSKPLRRVSFPHMGNLYLGMRALAKRMGFALIEAPRPNKAALELGSKYSPEFACLPLKVNVGTFIQALEKGADTLIQAGGTGPCRFGYYGEVQRRILEDLGYDFEMIIIEAPDNGDWSAFAGRIRALGGEDLTWLQLADAFQFAYAKLSAADYLEELSFKIRPRELTPGATTKALAKALKLVDKAQTRKALKQARREGEALLEAIPQRKDYTPPRVLIVGEIYVVLEPFVNMDTAVKLGELGLEVERRLWISEWVREHLLLGPLGLAGRKVRTAAAPLLGYFVGGEGLESVGNSVLAAREGVDGIVHLLPFTCMPETVAGSALDKLQQIYSTPLLRLIFDEQTGEAGVHTRLEAFADLLKRKARLHKAG